MRAERELEAIISDLNGTTYRRLRVVYMEGGRF